MNILNTFMPQNLAAEKKASSLSNTFSPQFKAKAPVIPALKADTFEPKFSGLTDEKYSVTLRWSDAIDADVASAVLRNLQLQDALLSKIGDDSNLQLNLDSIQNNGYPLIEESAMAESFQLLTRPVDVIVRSITAGTGIKTLQTATGNRLMHDRAELNFETTVFPHGRARNSQALMTNELNEEYLRELEQVLMSRVGISRKQANQLLNSGISFNPLEALNFGKKGLVDGVLVGYDQVVTRKNLKDYLAENKDQFASKEALKEFLYYPQNINKLPTTPLTEFSASSAGRTHEEAETHRPKLYKSIKSILEDAKQEQMEAVIKAQMQAQVEEMNARADEDQDNVLQYMKEWAEDTGMTDEASALLEKLQAADAELEQPAEEDEPLTIYKLSPDGNGAGRMTSDKFPLNLEVKPGQIRSGRTELDNLPSNRPILLDDTIYFNDGFDDETAEQITEALLMLDEKKSQQENPSNIKIVVNSPGGVIWSAMDINSTIRGLRTPVDIIVKGFAASCGSILLSGVTGNRYITPGAKVMLHEASSGLGRGNGIDDRSFTEGINKTTHAVVKTIADRAGRPFDKAMKEMEKDVWLNPLESLFYGDKGLVDGVIVGKKVVTRDQVYSYMLKQFDGNKEATDQYIENRIDSVGSTRLAPDFTGHDEKDPFDNAYKVIMTLAQEAAPLEEQARFEASVPRNNKETIEQVVVKTQPDLLRMLGLGKEDV